MKIILIKDINKLGKLGEQINVRAGYARNFLFPQKKAILATKKNIQYYSSCNTDIKNESKKETIEDSRIKVEKIQSIKKIIFLEKVGKKDKLFGSVNQKRISEKIKEITGISLQKKEIYLPNGSLRKLGSYSIQIRLQDSIFCNLHIEIKKS